MLTGATAMERAIALAWKGWGRVAPNPMVGCVLLRDGIVVGEGWHPEFGARHAEPLALEAAGDLARGATAVVTLEPCAHHGKQPPCTEALIAAGVRRVVVAVADPDPAAGGGARRLREAGIEVAFGTLADEVRRQNAAFLHRHANPGRPWTVLKLAVSLDGRIADAAGRSRWISGEPARAWVHWLRAGFDAIGVGGTTAGIDDPALTVRGNVTPRRAPLRVLFAGAAGVSAGIQAVATATEIPTLVVARPGTPGQPAWEAAGATTLMAETLSEAMGRLWDAGVQSLLVEGGGRLAGGMLAHGLVDRCCLVQAPIFLGAGGVPAVVGVDASVPDAERWLPVERRALGADTLLVLDRS